MIKYFIKKGTYIDDQKKIDVSKYDKIGEFKDGVAPVCSNEAFKYIDESGNEIISFNCDWAYDFNNGFGKVMFKDNLGKAHYSLVNKKGDIITHILYDEIGDFSDGLFKIKVNDKYGYIDSNGFAVIKPSFDKATNFVNDRAVVYNYNGNKRKLITMLIDKKGSILAKYENATIDEFKNNNYSVITLQDGLKTGIIDRNGNEVIKPHKKYAIKSFENSLFVISKPKGTGYKFSVLDNNGKIHELPSYEDCDALNSDVLRIKDNGSYFLADIDGNILSSGYEEIIRVSNNAYRVRKNGLYGIILGNGDVACEPIYNYITNYKFGVAPVKKDSRWGLINESGNEITDIIYNIITEFDRNGLATFKLDGKRGFLNSNGEVVSFYDKNFINDDDILSKTIIDSRYILFERVASPKYAIYDSKKRILTDFSFNSVRKNGNMIIFDEKYMVNINDLDFKYKFILEKDSKEIIKNFDSIKERDKYYSLASKEIQKADKEYKKRVDSLSKKLGEIIYKDLDKKIANEYKLRK